MNTRNILLFLRKKIFIYLLGSILISYSYAGLIEKNITPLYEIIDLFSSESLYLKNVKTQYISTNYRTYSEKKLRNFIIINDSYGAYFSKDEFSAYRESQLTNYYGIGMILYQKKRSSTIFCIPINKELIKKGISANDELISIDNKSVKGKSIYMVSSSARGKKDTYVMLAIRKPFGNIIHVKIKRKEQKVKTVIHTKYKNTDTMKITQFTKETPDEIINILNRLSHKKNLILDLRNNTGGDLFSAIESADLFLRRGTYITSVNTRRKSVRYNALNEDYSKSMNIVIMQNELTASAAEIFISALTDNHRAESIGSKSFGKGVAQKIVELKDKSAILFSYAVLISPNGNRFNNTGLYPTTDQNLIEVLDGFTRVKSKDYFLDF